MSVKPSHILMGVVGGVVYTAVCIGAGEEIEADMKQYLETHETESVFGKVKAVGYGTYRYGITLGKALVSTATICLALEGAVSPAVSTK